MSFTSSINLKLPQYPIGYSKEITDALIPVYNALRIIQEALSPSIGNSASIVSLQEAIIALETAGFITLTDIPKSFYFTIGSGIPDSSIGNTGDLYLDIDGTSRNLYIKDNESTEWKFVTVIGDMLWENFYSKGGMIYAGVYQPDISYRKGSVVVDSITGFSYVALVDNIINISPTDTTKWQRIGDTGGVISVVPGEAVISSRNPNALDDPDNIDYVVTGTGQLVYARAA